MPSLFSHLSVGHTRFHYCYYYYIVINIIAVFSSQNMVLFSCDSFIRIVCCWQRLLNQCLSNGIIIQLTCLAKLLQRKNVMIDFAVLL